MAARLRAYSLSLFALGIGAAHSAQAQGCPARGCRPDQFLPSPFDQLRKPPANVPANMQSFLFRAGLAADSAADGGLATHTLDGGLGDAASGDAATLAFEPRVYLRERFLGADVAVASNTSVRDGWLHITPKAALAPDTWLRIQLNDACINGSPWPYWHTFHITPAAPLPKTLGTLISDTPQMGASWLMADGTCKVDSFARTLSFHLALSEEAKPYADVLRFVMRVNGQRVVTPHDSANGANIRDYDAGVLSDQLSSPCLSDVADPRAIPCSPGAEVEMVGILPDDTEIPSNTLRVDLCTTPACHEEPYGEPYGKPTTKCRYPDAGNLRSTDYECERCPFADAPNTRRQDPACWEGHAPYSYGDGGGIEHSDDMPPETSESARASTGCSVGQRAASYSGWLVTLLCGWLYLRRKRARS